MSFAPLGGPVHIVGLWVVQYVMGFPANGMAVTLKARVMNRDSTMIDRRDMVKMVIWLDLVSVECLTS